MTFTEIRPEPKEVVHFDIIRPLLLELRQWSGSVTLVKIKSHTGCFMNERGDASEQASSSRVGRQRGLRSARAAKSMDPSG
jgi:hypothetical protein